MSDQKTAIDLSAFSAEYEIVGEQDSPDESRIFVANRKTDDARRRDDRTGVLITVYTTPTGDEANALTQFAADAGTLKGLTHRRLVPVLDSRWIGDDQLAVVTQRISDPTLAQKLLTQEEFHSTRIAAILREVNGLLEWAREQKIVHRRVTPEQVYLEPKTDRVRVTFAIAPIKRLKQPGPHDDARTIARLAVAMLGGDPDIQVCDQDMLLSLRPNLPQLFCQATAKLLDPRDTATPDDVAAFLGLISMADPLVEGETERDRIRAEILEEQRVEREKLAAERAAFDAKVAEERTAFDKQVSDERAALEKQMADERAAFEKQKAEERARVEHERQELEKAVTRERAEMQKVLDAERAALVARRDELERVVAEQRAELERAAAKDRAEIERLRAELRAAGDQEIEKKRLTALEDITGEEESVLDREDLAVPMFGMPVLPPIEPVTFEDASPLRSEEKIVFPPTPELERAVETERIEREATPGFWSVRRNQLIAAGAAAVIVIGGISAAVMSSRNAAVPVAARSAAVAPARPVTSPTTTVTSGGAVTATPAAPAPAPATVAFTVDSASARQWLDSLKRADPVDVPWAMDMARVRQERADRARLAAAREAARASSATTTPTVPGAEGILSQPAGVRATPRRDSSAPRRDTTGTRRDTTTVRRDTTPVRPDTTAVPPAA